MSFTAQIRIRRKGVTYQESETFDLRSKAAGWIEKREKELARPGGIADAKRRRDPTLSEVIDAYVKMIEETTGKPVPGSKGDALNVIKRSDLAAKRCADIYAQDYVDYCRNRIVRDGIKPQTNGNHMAYLGQIISIARPAWGYQIDEREFDDAKKAMRKLKLIKKSDERDRRPTLSELDLLMSHFEERERRGATTIPMTEIVPFAIFSTRRSAEICRIKWADLNEDHNYVIVRNMKNPGETEGNDVEVDLPEEAMAIIRNRKKHRVEGEDRIFPFNSETVGERFRDVCALKAIEDLTFHDLRHEGVSWLFEMGHEVPHVAKVSGHRDWNSLRRYTHLKGRGNKYENWSWRKKILATAEKIGT